MTPHAKTGAPSLPRPQNGRASWLIARRFSSFGKERGVWAERGGNRIRFAPRVASSLGSDGRLLSNSPCAQPAPLREGGARSAGGSTPCAARPVPFAASWLRASHAPRPVPHGVLPQSRFARQPPLGGGLCQTAAPHLATSPHPAEHGNPKQTYSFAASGCSLREAGAAPPRCAASPRLKRNADFGRVAAT